VAYDRILGDQIMQIKSLSPNNIIERHLITQNRAAPPQCQRRIRDITKMKAAHNARDKQAKIFFLKSAKHVPQELSSISMKQVQQSRI
jgi:hypothetical protein